jgi:hypothetical protein
VPDQQPDDWGVWVDEVKINATGKGGDWWALFDARFAGTGRITRLITSIAGGHHHVACDSREDAAALMETMSAQGIHPKCLRVARLSACRQAEQRRTRRVLAMLGEASDA